MTAVLCQFVSASSLALGAVLSTRIVRTAVVVELPLSNPPTTQTAPSPAVAPAYWRANGASRSSRNLRLEPD